MNKQDCEKLQWYQEDFLASHSVLPGSEEARTMTVTSGRKCSELYANSGPLGSLVRMCLVSSIWHSTRCFLTWKLKVTKSNVSLFQLAVSMPHTKDTAFLLWPTTSTGASLCGGTGNFKTLQKMAEKGLITEEERRGLSQGNGGKTNPELVEWLMGYEQKFTELVPTPRASDGKRAALNRCWMPDSQIVQVERERERERRYRGQLHELLELTPRGRIGLVNPEWVEWLMGFPIGWTDLSASETPLSHSRSTKSSVR